MKKTTINLFFLFLLFLISNSKSEAQDSYAGIEIGAKGFKVYVIDVRSIEKEIYLIDDFWSENLYIEKGIALDGNISKPDMNFLIKRTIANVDKLTNELKIDKSKIYILLSSGVSRANNAKELAGKITTAVGINAKTILPEIEAEFSFKNCVPSKKINESFVLDIGSGNTKGGFMQKKNGSYVFQQINTNIGTASVSESIMRGRLKLTTQDFIRELDSYIPTLTDAINKMVHSQPLFAEKAQIYASGGAVWAFYTLYNEGEAKTNFLEFKLKDVLKYDDLLRNSFFKFTDLAANDKEIARVLKTFSREELLAGNAILKTSLQALLNEENVSPRRIVFAKQPETSWVVSYIGNDLKTKK